jgi:hypothetical protein
MAHTIHRFHNLVKLLKYVNLVAVRDDGMMRW